MAFKDVAYHFGLCDTVSTTTSSFKTESSDRKTNVSIILNGVNNDKSGSTNHISKEKYLVNTKDNRPPSYGAVLSPEQSKARFDIASIQLENIHMLEILRHPLVGFCSPQDEQGSVQDHSVIDRIQSLFLSETEQKKVTLHNQSEPEMKRRSNDIISVEEKRKRSLEQTFTSPTKDHAHTIPAIYFLSLLVETAIKKPVGRTKKIEQTLNVRLQLYQNKVKDTNSQHGKERQLHHQKSHTASGVTTNKCANSDNRDDGTERQAIMRELHTMYVFV